MSKTVWRGLFAVIGSLTLAITTFGSLTHQASASAAHTPASHHAPATHKPKPKPTTTQASPPATTSPGGTTRSFYVTLYGWPDNSPPGGAIAYPKSDGNPTLHNTAGGTGTFADPVTYATDKAELPVGSKVYYPFLKKYFIMEDDCAECDQDWTGHGPDGGPNFSHIDLWVGGQGGNTGKVLDCEDALTQQGNVIIDPPADEPVDTTPLFNSSTNTCYSP